ncbi:hypothetical protein ABUW04_17895 [Streptacidiphilus sp. N1-10]|uniref:PH domain-containing protein n=1 Tax=Streptacidiphilus jeojiensis TaxID=3229225 RepID=A0ABV6XQD6_9ACTN
MTIIPVSPADVPARPWLAADAGRWATISVPLWARPLGPALLLFGSVVAAMVFSPACPACSVTAPCTTDWLDAVGTMAFLPHLLWLFLLPELAVVSAPLLLLWMTEPSTWQGGAGEKIADTVVVVALCWGWAAMATRLRTRRKARSAVHDAAGGITASAPAPGGPRVRQGLIRWVAGALACTVAAVLIAGIVLDDRADDRKAAAATAQDARVVAVDNDDYTLTVRLPDGTRHRFDVQGSYRNGSTVRVLVHGDWMRLASEPYGDPTDRQVVALLCAALGLTLLGWGLLAHRRDAALRRGPVPVLRVLTRRNHGRTEIFAADDTDALHPVLNYQPHDGQWTSLRQGLLYGAPCGGAALVLASATEAGQWLVEVNISAIRRGAAADSYARTAEREAAPSIVTEAQVQQALAAMAPASGPVRRQADAATRAVAALTLLISGAVVALMVASRWWTLILWVPLLCSGAVACLQVISWRITADAFGLRIRRMWHGHRVPWADVTGVVFTGKNELTISCRTGIDDVRVGRVAVPRLDRLLRRPTVGERAAVEISAMVLEPGLRPTDTV